MENQVNSLSLVTIMQLGAVTALVSTGSLWLQNWFTARSNRQRNASHLAVKLAVLLEAYAIQLAEIISDIELHDDSGGNAGNWVTSIPVLPEYPDGEWTSLDVVLLAKCLSMRNDIDLAQRNIDSFVSLVDPEPDEMSAFIRNNIGFIGYRAVELAKDLRRLYLLPVFNPGMVSWNIVNFLKKHYEAHLELLKKHM